MIKNIVLVCMALAVVILLGLQFFSSRTVQYKTALLPDVMLDSVQRVLDQNSQQGWRLVTVLPGSGYGSVAIFQR
jgi:hypothetical protein